MRRHLLPLGVASMSLLSGCYEYVRADTPMALVGRAVQVVLTDAGTTAETGTVGPSVETIDGTYIADSAGRAIIAVAMVHTRTGQEVGWRGERVAVPQQYIASFLERRLSHSRSVFAGGLALAGVVGATVALRGAGGASAGGGSPKPVGSQ